MRGFTLLELIIVAAITSIMAAISVPVVISAMNTRKTDSTVSKIERAVNAGRDASRDNVRCTTVATQVPPHGLGSRGLGVYLHNSNDCNAWIDYEYPEDQSTIVDIVPIHPGLVSNIEILSPTSGCVGTPPPVGCYGFAEMFRLDETGRVQEALGKRPPYRIRLSMVDGKTEHFVMQPETGTIRRDDGL